MILRLKDEIDIEYFESTIKRIGLYGQGMGRDKVSDMGTDYSLEKMTADEVKDLLKVCKLLDIELEIAQDLCDGDCENPLFDSQYLDHGERFCSDCIEKYGDNKSDNCFLKTN